MNLKYLLLFLLTCNLSICFDGLVNGNASPETKQLYKTLTDNYGKYVFSGQTTFNYDDFVSKTG